MTSRSYFGLGFSGLLCLSLLLGQIGNASRVAVCITATGRYVEFAKQLIQTMRPWVMVGHDVTYFVFTNQPMKPERDVRVVSWPQFGWPGDSMNRTSAYLSRESELTTYDWILASDADMLCVGPIEEDFFAETVGVTHPNFAPGEGVWEQDPRSTAYLPPALYKTYFCGGVYGGSPEGFFRICRFCKANQETDARNGIMATVHDESHLNCFFGYNPPSKTMGTEYCWSDGRPRADARILCITKHHAWWRTPEGPCQGTL
ncbi:MAG: hypothetical protein ACOYKZ_06875 [Chlamydiia bacterium]